MKPSIQSSRSECLKYTNKRRTHSGGPRSVESAAASRVSKEKNKKTLAAIGVDAVHEGAPWHTDKLRAVRQFLIVNTHNDPHGLHWCMCDVSWTERRCVVWDPYADPSHAASIAHVWESLGWAVERHGMGVQDAACGVSCGYHSSFAALSTVWRWTIDGTEQPPALLP